MWAAANDGFSRRRHRDKRRRIELDANGKDAGKRDGNADKDIDSDSDSDSSSDGERSTTESIHEGDNLDQSTQGDTSHASGGLPKKKRSRNKRKRKKKKQIREETPEATMARLKSSYSAAMGAVGALHRVSQEYSFWKQEEAKKKNDGTHEELMLKL